MEPFTEEHAKSLLSKEWLVKVDSENSTPYLFKYTHSMVDLSCWILVTDSKSVWAEVLNPKSMARRWRSCNINAPEPYENAGDEDTWRNHTLDLLSKAHTLGGLLDISFEVVETNYSDFSFILEHEKFKWRWETSFLGHQRSAEIISKQLIQPLITLNHVAFSSGESLEGMADTDLEKGIDKISRTSRRSVDNHIKNVLSKPKIATSLRRITAMFSFMADVTPVTSTPEKPILVLDEEEPPTHRPSPLRPKQAAPLRNSSSPVRVQQSVATPSAVHPKPTPTPVEEDSVTESESEEEKGQVKSKPPMRLSSTGPSVAIISSNISSEVDSSMTSQTSHAKGPPSPNPLSRPAKKTKISSSSDEESDDRASRGTSAASNTVRKTKQPLQRNKKRF